MLSNIFRFPKFGPVSYRALTWLSLSPTSQNVLVGNLFITVTLEDCCSKRSSYSVINTFFKSFLIMGNSVRHHHCCVLEFLFLICPRVLLAGPWCTLLTCSCGTCWNEVVDWSSIQEVQN